MPYDRFTGMLQVFAIAAWLEGTGRRTSLKRVFKVAKKLTKKEDEQGPSTWVKHARMEAQEDITGKSLALISVFYWLSEWRVDEVNDVTQEEIEFTHKNFSDYLVARTFVAWGFGKNDWFGTSRKHERLKTLGPCTREIADLMRDIMDCDEVLKKICGEAPDFKFAAKRANDTGSFGYEVQPPCVKGQATFIMRGLLARRKFLALHNPSDYVPELDDVGVPMELHRRIALKRNAGIDFHAPTWFTEFLSFQAFMTCGFENVVLRGERFERVSVTSSVFDHATFNDCVFRDCRFSQTSFVGVNFSNCSFQNCTFEDEITFDGCDFSRVEGCYGNRLDGANFKDCTVSAGFDFPPFSLGDGEISGFKATDTHVLDCRQVGRQLTFNPEIEEINQANPQLENAT